MSKTANAAPRGSQSNRPNASRALLIRKAVEKLGQHAPFGEDLESSFPTSDFIGPIQPAADVCPASTANREMGKTTSLEYIELIAASASPAIPADDHGSKAGPQGDADLGVGPPPAWSADDETAYQALAARRKASGYQRRGKNVADQLLKVGDISPNPNTVVSVIVALIAERGVAARSVLLDAMALAAFPHPKAKPQDRDWCQGYISGAVRDGYLAVAGPEAASGAPEQNVVGAEL